MSAPARGPLRILQTNPRYFTGDGVRAVFLTGSHTWNNLQEISRLPSRPNPAVDFTRYLDFLQARRHNCFRIWTWEHAASFDAGGKITYEIDPLPFARTGPGNALDGKPRFDVRRFNEAYFKRLRERVTAAGARGMYVIVMLFEGFSVIDKGGPHDDPWKGHPFHAANNVNGVDGDPARSGKGPHANGLSIPALLAAQEAYVRKVVDTVNDLDNVLYEIANENDGGAEDTAWQYHMIEYIRNCEAGKAKRHPVGMTAQWPGGSNKALFESPADWISPNEEGGFQTDPPAADGSKVILNDTDHSFYFVGLKDAGIDAQRAWVWKNLARGNQTLFMDPYIDPAPWYVLTRNGPQGGEVDPYWDILRVSMGYSRMYADRMNLAAMTPRSELASSEFCLASTAPGKAEYLAYLPRGPWVTVDLSAVSGCLSVEWFNPSTGAVVKGETVTGGARRALTAPFGPDAVLYLVQAGSNAAL